MKPYTPDRPPPVPDYVLARQVDASTAESIAVPSGAVCFRATSLTAFYLKPDGTAAAATGDVTDGSASILVPAAADGGASRVYGCEGVANLSVLSSSGTILIYAEFWGKQ
jgi:hypothetical protein